MFKFALKPLIAALAIGTSLTATAASNCKGQTQSACSNSSSCYWVEGYKRTDGAKVKAHCRAKPSKSAVKKAKPSSDSSKKKAEDKAKSAKKKADKKAKDAKKTKASDTKKKSSSKKTTSSKKSSDKKTTSSKKSSDKKQ